LPNIASAATAQKPQAVIDRVSRYYVQENSNIHRGTHTLAEVACDAYEDARDSVAVFMNAGWQDEIVFVRGTTEGINLLAATFADTLLKPGDEIVLTEAEHHANIVPWQFAAKKSGAVIRIAASTCKLSAATSTYFPATSCSAPAASVPSTRQLRGRICASQSISWSAATTRIALPSNTESLPACSCITASRGGKPRIISRISLRASRVFHHRYAPPIMTATRKTTSNTAENISTRLASATVATIAPAFRNRLGGLPEV